MFATVCQHTLPGKLTSRADIVVKSLNDTNLEKRLDSPLVFAEWFDDGRLKFCIYIYIYYIYIYIIYILYILYILYIYIYLHTCIYVRVFMYGYIYT